MRFVVGLLVLLGLGGMAFAISIAMKPQGGPTAVAAKPPPPKAHILVASRPVRAGALLALEDVGSKDVDPDKIPPASFVDTIANRSMLRGAMVRHSFNAGQPLESNGVLSPGDRGFLAAVLAPGMRAVTVGVDPVSGTAGLIWPGDRVDLVLTQAIDDKDQPIDRRISGELVLSDVRVIAVDQQLVQGGQGSAPAEQSASQNRTVTLEATPYDAERVTVAQRLGRLSLVVRSALPAGAPDDTASPPQTTVSEPVTASAAPAPAVPPAIPVAAVGMAPGAVSMVPKVGVPGQAATAPTVATAPSTPADAAAQARAATATARAADGTPIAWGGDVSTALRDLPTGKAGLSVRVFSGSTDPKEIKF